MKHLLIVLIESVFFFAADGQQIFRYNLAKMLDEDKLVIQPNRQVKPLHNEKENAVTAGGIVWLKNVSFNEGTVDIDLRGKNVFLKSFLGIAFHAADTNTYETVYFRPFNFNHNDTMRKWSVQYMCLPEFSYDTLRKMHPLVYENAVSPVPAPDSWFHATIVIQDGWIAVYVNHSKVPSLRVEKLNHLVNGKIGLWSDGEFDGDFANLSITK